MRLRRKQEHGGKFQENGQDKKEGGGNSTSSSGCLFLLEVMFVFSCLGAYFLDLSLEVI